MAVINTNIVCDLQKAVKVEYIDGVLFSQDNQANKINVTVLDGGEPATISGTVSANIVRSDGGTVAATGGSITGNVASITLPAAAYAVPGIVSIVVKLTASGVITTIAAIVANVYRASTDTAIDPGTVIPSIQTLISQINAAVASIPADYSALWTKLAPAFSPDASYVAGQYVTNNSGLYRFNTTHTGDWSSSDVTAVNLGGEISDLKSALNSISSIHKNLLPLATKSATVNNVDAVYADGVLTLDGTANGGGGRTTKLTDEFVLSAGTYTASVSGDILDMYVETVSGNNIIATLNTTTPVTFTLNAETGLYIGVNTVNDREYSSVINIQIEKGSTATVITKPSYATAIDIEARTLTNEMFPVVEDVKEVYTKSLNLLPTTSKTSTVNDVTVKYSDGAFDIHGTASGGGGRTTKLTDTFELKAGTYTIYCDIVVADFYLQSTSGNTVIATVNTLTPVTFTLNADTTVYLGCGTVLGREYYVVEHIQLQEGSTATRYLVPSFISAIDTVARDLATEPNVIVPFIQTSVNSGFKIYLRTRGNYICYTVLHQIVTAKNCDSWRIEAIDGVDINFENAVTLTTSGELECAIMLQGRPDYIGGRAHGNEVTTSIRFIVDGKVFDPSNITDKLSFNKLTILSVSNLYDPNDSATLVGEHGKEYEFTESGLKLTQYIVWEEPETIDQLYLSMLLGAKTATDKGYTNKTFTPFVLAENYGYYDDIDFVAEYSDTLPIFMSMSAEVYPCPTGHDKPQLRLTDNNSDYNKAYFVGYSGTVSAGDRMDSVTRFEFKYNEYMSN